MSLFSSGFYINSKRAFDDYNHSSPTNDSVTGGTPEGVHSRLPWTKNGRWMDHVGIDLLHGEEKVEKSLKVGRIKSGLVGHLGLHKEKEEKNQGSHFRSYLVLRRTVLWNDLLELQYGHGSDDSGYELSVKSCPSENLGKFPFTHSTFTVRTGRVMNEFFMKDSRMKLSVDPVSFHTTFQTCTGSFEEVEVVSLGRTDGRLIGFPWQTEKVWVVNRGTWRTI